LNGSDESVRCTGCTRFGLPKTGKDLASKGSGDLAFGEEFAGGIEIVEAVVVGDPASGGS
jgi:hypothetical protein